MSMDVSCDLILIVWCLFFFSLCSCEGLLLGDRRDVLWPNCVVERQLQIVSDNRCVMLEKN